MVTSADTNSEDSSGLHVHTALSELGMIQLGDQPLNATLLQIAEIAKRTVANLHEVSITVMKSDTPRTAVFTGRLAVDLDERQYENGFGPCIDAATSGDLIVVDTNDTDNPYPDFSRSARNAGINQVISVGLPSSAQMPAGLNLYATQRQPMNTKTVTLVKTFATYAAVAVGNAATHNNTQQLAAQVQELVKSRAVIEQAKGILMAQHGYNETDAFTTLTRTSQNRNMKLRDVAHSIVASISNQ